MTKHTILQLPPDERSELERLISSGNAPARVQTRARILLLSDKSQQNESKTQEQIAQSVLVSRPTISRISRCFVQEGVKSALYEKPRPGKAPKITGAVEAQLTLLACSTPPAGRASWTMQMLADKLVELKLVESISDSAVCDRLKKTRSNRGR